MKQKKYIILTLLVTMISMWALVPPMPFAHAVDSIYDAKDLLSDSDPTASSSHTFTFTTSSSTPTNGYWRFVFEAPAGFDYTDISVSCDNGAAGWTASTTAALNTVDCVRTGAARASGIATTTMYGIDNPAAEGTRYITIYNYDDNNVLREKVKVAVAIVQDVWVTATVDSMLTFTVSGTTTGAVINGLTCDQTSTATTVPFGTLDFDPREVCQTLNVQTNANDGYTVTVWQDHELLSDSGANINSFNNSPDNTGSTTAQAWVAPSNTLDVDNTYGHMGLHSNDDDLSGFSTGYNDFYQGAAYFVGLNNTQPMPVMHHDGASDGTTQNVGLVSIAYRIEIESLQQAGDYESTLTYICTPQF